MKDQGLINLFCLNFSSPWSTFQTQAFLGKECTLSQGARKGATPQTLKTHLPQIPTPFLKSRICNANLSTFLHPGKKINSYSSSVWRNSTFSQYFLNSFLEYEFVPNQTKPKQNKTLLPDIYYGCPFRAIFPRLFLQNNYLLLFNTLFCPWCWNKPLAKLKTQSH